MRGAAVAVVGLLVGCSGNDTPQTFATPDAFATSGIAVTPGTTAVIGLGTLQLTEPGPSVSLVRLHVEGDQAADPAGEVLGVKVYSMAESGGIGAITESSLDGVEGNPGWQLKQPAGVAVGAQEPMGVAVVVRGRSIGSWSSDSLVVDYKVGDRSVTQKISIGAELCVVVDVKQGCNH